MSILEQTLNELIARDFGIKPEEVTLEFIREQRKKLEPHWSCSLRGTVYEGLEILTPAQAQRVLKEVDTIATLGADNPTVMNEKSFLDAGFKLEKVGRARIFSRPLSDSVLSAVRALCGRNPR